MDTATPQRVRAVVVADPVRTQGMSVHGQPLTTAALAALADWCDAVLVGSDACAASTPLEQLCAGADRIVVHDPLCPLLTPAALRACVAALLPGEAVVGIRPVTDTLKSVTDGLISSTVERDTLAVLASPVVFAADVVAALSRALPTAGDLADPVVLVGALGDVCRLRSVTVPSAGRRISDFDDLAVLAALAEAGAS